MANKNTLNRANEFSLFWAAASRPKRCGERGGGLVKVCTECYFFRIKGVFSQHMACRDFVYYRKMCFYCFNNNCTLLRKAKIFY